MSMLPDARHTLSSPWHDRLREKRLFLPGPPLENFLVAPTYQVLVYTVQTGRLRLIAFEALLFACMAACRNVSAAQKGRPRTGNGLHQETYHRDFWSA